MRVVYKYVVAPGNSLVEMNDGAELIHVDWQDHTMCVWAVVDPNAPLRTRNLFTVMTGEPMNGELTHVGTVLVHDGVLVVHLFDGGWL